MTRLTLLLCALTSLLVFSACQNDDDDFQPLRDNTLSYDGPNFTGPLLDAGFYEAAARFPAQLIQANQGRELDAVRFFMGELPAGCEVRIYEGTGANNQPQNLIFSQDVTNDLAVPGWNRLLLNPPIVLGEDDLWLSIALQHDATQQSIGCDSGPNQPNGDWLYQSNDGLWLPYTERTPESVNWNIQGELKEE